MSKWKFGDVLEHPDDAFVTQVMFIAEFVAFVLHDEDATVGIHSSPAWPVGIQEVVGLDYWKKVEV